MFRALAQDKLQKKFRAKLAEAQQRLQARRDKWDPCWIEIKDYPARVKAYRERMAALKIQRLYRGMLGRRKAKHVYMLRRLKSVRQVGGP
jgi:hypothetical protein